MSCMSRDDLRRVSPEDIRLLHAIAAGATYREIAGNSARKPTSVARAFELLREKLRPWGGGSKSGLVHWIDTHYEEWTQATGIHVAG